MLYHFFLKIVLLLLLFVHTTKLYSNEIEPISEEEQVFESILEAFNKYELEKASDLSMKLFEKSKSKRDFENYQIAAYYAFIALKRQYKHSEAIIFLKNELVWNQSIKNNENIQKLNYYIALVYKDIKDIENAQLYFFNALKVLEILDYDEEKLATILYRLYTELAIIMIDCDAQKSFDYLHEAHLQALELNDSIKIADSYLNIGWANIEIHNYNIAEKYLDSAYYLYELKNSLKGKTSIYLEQGILEQYKSNFKVALEFYDKSYELLFQPKNVMRGSYFLKKETLKKIASIHKEENDFDKALSYALQGLKLAEMHKDKSEIAANTKFIAEIYDLDQQRELALKYYKLSNEYFQLLEVEDSKLNVIKQEYAYRSSLDKKALTNAVIVKNKSTRRIWILSAIIILMLITALYFFRKLNLRFGNQSKIIKEKEAALIKKTQKMADLSLINQSKNQYLDYLQESLKEIYSNSEIKSPELQKLILFLKRNVNKEDEWERFRKYHTELDPSFYQEIQQKWPQLSNLDIRHCTLIKLKFSSKQAAEVLGVSPKSVQMARYRLKKKLAFQSQAALKKYLMSI